MMGLIDGSLVPPLRAYESASPLVLCDEPVINITTNVTIEQIQEQFGARTPGPASARKDYHMAFVAPSLNRFLTKTEMTYYDILAREYTAPLAPTDPAPLLQNDALASIDRFFGEGTTWRSALPLSGPLMGVGEWGLHE